MNLYRFYSDPDNFDVLDLVDLSESDKLFDFFFTPVRFWSGRRFSANLKERKTSGKKSDFRPVLYPGIPVLVDHAWKKVENDLRNDFLSIPIHVEGSTYYLLKPRRVIDCIDRSSTVFGYYSNGRIMEIDEISVIDARLKNVLAFRIPERDGGEIFYTDEFYNLVEAHKFTGAKLVKVPVAR